MAVIPGVIVAVAVPVTMYVIDGSDRGYGRGCNQGRGCGFDFCRVKRSIGGGKARNDVRRCPIIRTNVVPWCRFESVFEETNVCDQIASSLSLGDSNFMCK